MNKDTLRAVEKSLVHWLENQTIHEGLIGTGEYPSDHGADCYVGSCSLCEKFYNRWDNPVCVGCPVQEMGLRCNSTPDNPWGNCEDHITFAALPAGRRPLARMVNLLAGLYWQGKRGDAK